jgi:V/A-type H+-transporting ATPase subunit I
MIKKMKKLSLFVFHADKLATLDMLASRGVLHIDMKNGITSGEIDTILSKKNSFQKSKSIIDVLLSRYEKKKTPIVAEMAVDSSKNISERVEEIIAYSDELEKITSTKDTLNKEINTISPFGDFSFDKVKALEKDTGYIVTFHVASAKEFSVYDFSKHEGITLCDIKEDKGKAYFAVFKKIDNEEVIPFDNVSFNKKSLSELRKELEEVDNSILSVESKILSFRSYIPLIDESMLAFNNDIHLEEAKESFEESDVTEGKVLLITAYVPKDKENTLRVFLNDNKIAYIMTDPSANDNIPVMLQSNRYSGAFQMITKLFQLPYYFELDLTPMIAFFYPIFFAFCFGDSGYGLVLTVLSIVGLLTKLKGKMVDIGIIGVTLGVLTMVMGVMNSGVVFGVNFATLQNIPIFYELSKFTFITDAKPNWFLPPFNAALLCGLFQIIIALILNVVNRIRYGDIADICGAVGKLLLIPGLVLWFLGDMQNMPVIKSNFSPYYYYLIIVGLIGISILTNIGKKPDVLNSILSIYFAVTGFMGDILSYIRLFALGASSGILGFVVNDIALSFLGVPFVGVAIMILFLIVGHAGNFALSILGSLVHPLRLTFVEFYNNVGFKGGGKEYKPLKKTEAFKI